MYVCVSARVRVHACVRACVSVCVRVCVSVCVYPRLLICDMVCRCIPGSLCIGHPQRAHDERTIYMESENKSFEIHQQLSCRG